MITSPYPFFQSLSREISQMQSDYRNMHPLDLKLMTSAVSGLRQDYVPVLTDGAFANQLAIVRGHGKEGYMTVVLDANPEALAFYSRFSIPVSSPGYYEVPDEFWGFVLDVGRQIREVGKMPVLTIGDAEWLLPSMLEFGVELLAEVFAINQDYELQNRLLDKYYQYCLAKEAGVPVPDTWLPSALKKKSIDQHKFPVLIKERGGKKMFKETGRQAFEMASGEELEAFFWQVEQPDDFLIQEKISDNGQENMFSIGAYCGKERTPLALFSSQRKRSTRTFGSTALSISEPCKEGIAYSEKFLKHVGYYGSCELEFIYDPSRDKLLFLEINTRLYKTQSLAMHCGINFNNLALLQVMGKTPSNLPQQIYGPRWWLAWSDLASGIRKISKGEMTFGELMEPLSFDFVNGIDDLDDPLPGFVNLFNGKF